MMMMMMMMMMKFTLVVIACTTFATATNEATQLDLSSLSASSTKAMEQVFFRSEETHEKSMKSIMSVMSLTKAVQSLEKRNLSTPELVQVANMAMGKSSKSNLRAAPATGYSGLDGARNLLNDMIYESMTKYDAEIAKCTDYYARQCGAMAACRGQISASNYIAANSRALILDAQADINKCEADIPTKKLQLAEHLVTCKREQSKLNTRLKIVMGDIAIMTTILEMTDCDKNKTLMQRMSLLHCTHECTKKSFIEFND